VWPFQRDRRIELGRGIAEMIEAAYLHAACSSSTLATFSITIAMPWPPPMHIVIKP
jgi:hypothetical protein